MIKVVGYRLVVKVDELEEMSEGGIALVSSKHEENRVQTGVVLGIGDYAFRAFDRDEMGRPIGLPWCKVGDRVVFSQYAARKFKDEETKEDVAFLNDDDVIAVIEEA